MSESVKTARSKFRAIARYGCGGLILFALSGTTFISLRSVQALSVEVSQLKIALQQSPDIAPIQLQLAALQQQFETLRSKQSGMAEKTALMTLRQQVETLEKQLHEQAALVSTVNSGLSSLQSQLHSLNQHPASPASVQMKAPAAKVTKKKSPVKAQRQVAAPFVLTGIERRGGIAFAAIAPQSATQLTEVSLMEPGETRQGWTLQTITGQQATFRVSGQTQTLTVR